MKNEGPDNKPHSLADWADSISKRLSGSARKLEQWAERAAGRMENAARRLEEAGGQMEKAASGLEAGIQKQADRLEGWLERPDFILNASGLKKYYTLRQKNGASAELKAVDGVDLDIVRGETLGVVGESGCGKSTLARALIGLTPPTGGEVKLDGESFSAKARAKELRRRTGMVFQDPYGSLDPRMSIAEIVAEPLRAYGIAPDRDSRLLRVLNMLEACGMRGEDMFKFPHQFSGGQRQRICIARALAAQPDLVVCDEAVSALDVSVQAQIINLLCDLREQRSLTYIFITHDLEVVRFIADRVAVMYLGRIMEIARKEEIFNNPKHPYTKLLLESAPVFGRRAVIRDAAPDTPVVSAAPETGCRFYSRCPDASAGCAEAEPPLRALAQGHSAACYKAAVIS